ncbi:MAG: hypothetical protein R2882_10960 [Gemmatimonadales bacterium]
MTEEGDPRLLDFGIAKLLSDTDDPLRTETGRGLLTPQYAARNSSRASHGHRFSTSWAACSSKC